MLKLKPEWKKRWVLVLVLLSLFLRVEHRYFFRNFYIDTDVQLAAVQNWYAGNGFTAKTVNFSDLSKISYTSERRFMPGFGMAVLPLFLWLGAWFEAVFMLDILSLCLIFLGMHLLFGYLFGRHDHPAYLFYLLFMAMSPAPLHYLTSSGMLCLGLLLPGVWALLSGLAQEKIQWGKLLIAVILLGLAGWIRYAYLPLLLVIPALAGVLWLATRTSGMQRATIITGMITGIILIFSAWEQQQHETWLVHSTFRLYPENLQYIDPFLFKAFFYYGIPHALKIQALSPWLYAGLQGIAYGVSALIGGLSLYYGWYYMINKREWEAPVSRMLLVGFGITGLNLGLLMYLSLTIAPDDWNWIGYWTFVMETRYYVPTMMFVILVMLFLAWHAPHRIIQKSTRLFLILALITAWTYPVYVKYRIHILNQRADTFQESVIPAWVQALSAIPMQPDIPRLVAAPLGSRAGELTGAVTIGYDALIIRDSLFTTGPAELFVLMPAVSAQTDREKAFLKSFPAKNIKAIQSYEMYRIDLPKVR